MIQHQLFAEINSKFRYNSARTTYWLVTKQPEMDLYVILHELCLVFFVMSKYIVMSKKHDTVDFLKM